MAQQAANPRDPIHKPLSSPTSIRVLILHPSILDAPIRLNLAETDIASRKHISYEAISYTWGPPDAQHRIEVDGAEIHIRSNLWNCLRKLRSTDQPRTLWADAICISQTDLIEKGQQVSIIGDVFEKATRVLVWLGEDSDRNQILVEGPELGQDHAGQPGGNQRLLWTVFNRRYWRRRWIIQELIVARDVLIHCDGKWINSYGLESARPSFREGLADFYPALLDNDRQTLEQNIFTFEAIATARASRITSSSLESRFSAFAAYSGSKAKSEAGYTRDNRFVSHDALSQHNPLVGPGRNRWRSDSILTYLEQFRHSECENSLDQIYAFLSLAKGRSKKLPFHPDYIVSIPTLLINIFTYVLKDPPYQACDSFEILFRSLQLRFTTDDLLLAFQQFSENKTLKDSAVKKAALLAFTRWEIFRLPGTRHITYEKKSVHPFEYLSGTYNFREEFPASRWYASGSSKKQTDLHFEEMVELLKARQTGDLEWFEGFEETCKRSDKPGYVKYDLWRKWKESIRGAWAWREEDEEDVSSIDDGIGELEADSDGG